MMPRRRRATRLARIVAARFVTAVVMYRRAVTRFERIGGTRLLMPMMVRGVTQSAGRVKCAAIIMSTMLMLRNGARLCATLAGADVGVSTVVRRSALVGAVQCVARFVRSVVVRARPVAPIARALVVAMVMVMVRSRRAARFVGDVKLAL